MASVGPVLGSADGEVHEEDGEGREEDGLEKTLETAGSVILEEYEHQRQDALSFFPCTALLRAGRQLVGGLEDRIGGNQTRCGVMCHA